MSNFGWVPRPDDEVDDYLERLALLVERRPNMDMIEIVSTLHDFVEEANVRQDPPPPINDELVVGGHANLQGTWQVDPFTDASQTDFETLDASMNTAFRSIKIPDALIGFDPVSPQPTARAFHVKGCSIGTAEPWLVKLRAALGDHVRVTAPVHFHGVSTNGTPGVTPVEVIEWMAYEITVFQKTPFTTLNTLAAAFRAKNVKRRDGVFISLGSIKAWLKAMRVPHYDRSANVRIDDVRLPLGLNIGGHTYAEGEMAFTIQTKGTSVVFWTVEPPDAIPPTHAERVAKLSSWLPLEPSFQDTHPFPRFKRVGYPTLAAMIAGLDWRFGVGGTTATPTIDCIGGRFEYTLQIPIANPGPSGTLRPTRAPLIFNHVPESGAPAVAPAFDETDTFFYKTVP